MDIKFCSSVGCKTSTLQNPKRPLKWSNKNIRGRPSLPPPFVSFHLSTPIPKPEPEPKPKPKPWLKSYIVKSRSTESEGVSIENNEEQGYGEVSRIIGSKAIDGKMQYLLEWKDGHTPTWVPLENIAKDVVEEYEGPWWSAIKKGDEAKLRELLEDVDRDVDAVDEYGRTGLIYVAGLGSVPCITALAEAGADLDIQDRTNNFTALHIASGYMKPEAVKVLLELGADPEIPDSAGRTPVALVKELLEQTPKGNPLQFARRMGLESVIKCLEDAVFETAEVDQILDKRSVGERLEYLVRWKDGCPDEWLAPEDIGEDLVQDYEAGLEYGLAERILDRKEEDGVVLYLVKWADIETPTWEPTENLDTELVAEFEGLTIDKAHEHVEAS